MRWFCTYFDKNFLIRGLTLYESLRRHCPDAQMCIVCLDDDCREILNRLELPGVKTFSLAQLESYEPRLVEAKGDRSLLEYYYTLTPIIILFALDHFSESDMLTYLDSDLFFFDDPEPLFEELGQDSISIIAHRFPPKLLHLAKFGIYNVAWLTFRKDDRAAECLRWWKDRCLEWCCDRLEGNRYADQKYLDDWPERFPGVTVLQHKGANLAPWNLANYQISENNGSVRVDGGKLIFFHFHRFRQIASRVYDTNLAPYGAKASATVRRAIFEPYIQALLTTTARIERVSPGTAFDLGVRRHDRDIVVRLKRMFRTCQKVLNGDFIFFRSG